jgi:amino-acid N-acetyltransferase
MPSSSLLRTAAELRQAWRLHGSDRGGDSEPPLLIRQAEALDQAAITRLVHSERLNPNGLDWKNFMVAISGTVLIGAVQMRQHPEGSRELGSLVVSREHRGHGIAERLISAMLARHPGPVHVITRSANAVHYRPWGFARIDPRDAPRTVRRHRLMGQMVSVMSLITGRGPRRLVVLRRL